jgi:hypothetical protein
MSKAPNDSRTRTPRQRSVAGRRSLAHRPVMGTFAKRRVSRKDAKTAKMNKNHIGKWGTQPRIR